MKKNQPDNDFKFKFHLLNSQECPEEIIWSCSDSSDYETPIHIKHLGKAQQNVNRKRKRGKTRNKTSKNLSNLNISIAEAPLENINKKTCNQSPSVQKVILSPILTRSAPNFAPLNSKKVLLSPILTCKSKKSSSNQTKALKSPIIVLNHASPKISPNVRKKLFSHNNIEIETQRKENRNKSPVLNCTQILNKSREDCYENHIHNDALKTNFKFYNKEVIIDHGNMETTTKTTRLEEDNLSNTLTTKTASVALCEKVRSYFDSHFSSETPSQQSISEYESTPKNSSKTSEEIEIINSQNDTKHMPQVIKLENKSSSDTLSSYEFAIEKSKKVKYKKDGLAYRLNVLLKKQKANISLWQHERFLAANSNFIIPHDKFTAFRVLNITFKYGCYILEVIDVSEKKYFVLINHLYINSTSLEQCVVFKLYKPYKILDFNSDYQLIVNVSKFDCTVNV